MAEAPFPPRWHEVVRRHHADTAGYVAAQSGDCLQVRDEERALVRGRRFEPLPLASLPVRRPRSWFLGVLLCPGDTTEAVAKLAQLLGPRDLDRIHFYYVPQVALSSALAAWRAAGLREPRSYPIRDFRSFHHLFGRHHGDRVHVDHASP